MASHVTHLGCTRHSLWASPGLTGPNSVRPFSLANMLLFLAVLIAILLSTTFANLSFKTAFEQAEKAVNPKSLPVGMDASQIVEELVTFDINSINTKNEYHFFCAAARKVAGDASTKSTLTKDFLLNLKNKMLEKAEFDVFFYLECYTPIKKLLETFEDYDSDDEDEDEAEDEKTKPKEEAKEK